MRIHPFIYAALAIFFWAGNAIVGKIASGEIPAFTLSLWRWIMAAAILCPFTFKAFWQQRHWYWDHKKEMFWLAFLSVSLYNSLQYLALNYTSPGNVGIVCASTPLFILLLNGWLNRQAILLNQVAGIMLAMAGVIYVIVMGSSVALAINPGDVIMLTAVISFSVYSVLLKRLPSNLNAGGLLLVLMVLGVIGILPFFAVDIANDRTWDWQAQNNWLILFYVALFPSIGSFFFWNYAVKKGGPMLTGLSFNLQPVFTMILAYFILKDPVLPSQVFAVLLIFSGIALGLWRKEKK